jgi:hypothetical protein
MQNRTKNHTDANPHKLLLGPLEEALRRERRKLDALRKTERQRVQEVPLAAVEPDQTKTRPPLLEIIPPTKRVATAKNGREATIRQETKFPASAVSNSQSTARIAIIAPAENQTKRPRGSGSIFKNGSSTFWIKFSERGIPRRESSHSTDRKDAEKLLKRRLAEIETQTYIPRQNVRIDELIVDVLTDHKDNGRKSTEQVEGRWRLHLQPFFTRMRASDVTTQHLRRYIAARRDQCAEPATINRELALLRRAFNLGLESTPPKVRIVPHFPMLKESNVRRGFLESDQYDRVSEECAKAGLWMRANFELGFTYGWRLHELTGEQGLRVGQVNFFANTIRLHPGETKNDDAREVDMTQPVRELLRQCVHGKGPNDYVFTRENGGPVIDFRKTWEAVCVRAGVGELVCPDCDEAVDGERHCAVCGRDWDAGEVRYEGLLFHDLRRTAVRGMIRAGISEKVAMTVSGHRTRSIFDRYHIVSPSDIRDAARKLEAKRAQEAEQMAASERSKVSQFGQSLGRVAPKQGQVSGFGSGPLQSTLLPN